MFYKLRQEHGFLIDYIVFEDKRSFIKSEMMVYETFMISIMFTVKHLHCRFIAIDLNIVFACINFRIEFVFRALLMFLKIILFLVSKAFFWAILHVGRGAEVLQGLEPVCFFYRHRLQETLRGLALCSQLFCCALTA